MKSRTLPKFFEVLIIGVLIGFMATPPTLLSGQAASFHESSPPPHMLHPVRQSQIPGRVQDAPVKPAPRSPAVASSKRPNRGSRPEAVQIPVLPAPAPGLAAARARPPAQESAFKPLSENSPPKRTVPAKPVVAALDLRRDGSSIAKLKRVGHINASLTPSKPLLQKPSVALATEEFTSTVRATTETATRRLLVPLQSSIAPRSASVPRAPLSKDPDAFNGMHPNTTGPAPPELAKRVVASAAAIAPELLAPSPLDAQSIFAAAPAMDLQITRVDERTVALSWSNTPTGFFVQETDLLGGSLAETPWRWIPQTPQEDMGRLMLTRSISGSRFFRLVRKGMAFGLEHLLAQQDASNTWSRTGSDAVRDTATVLETLALLNQVDQPYSNGVTGLNDLLAFRNEEIAWKTLVLAEAGRDAADLTDELLARQSPESLNPGQSSYPGRYWGETRLGGGSPRHTALALRALHAGGRQGGLCVVRETLPPLSDSPSRRFAMSACASNLLLKVRLATGVLRFTLTTPGGTPLALDLSPLTNTMNVTVPPQFLVPGNWTFSVSNTNLSPAAYTAEVGMFFADGSDTFRYTTPLVFLGLSQNPDGGWGAARGQSSQVEDTAEVIRLLAELRDSFGPDQKLQSAVTWLQAHRNPDGGFSTSPSRRTIRETSLAAAALRAANAPTSLSNTVAYLRALQLHDGSWNADVYDTALTVQALYLPPRVSPIPGQSVFSPNPFAPVRLDDYRSPDIAR